ncbi:MAG TPA: hypothetical protein V6C88_01125 [Chroococcidiopsis sp.]
MAKTGFGVGLQIWIIFLIIFFLLKYPALLSIMLGALAGLAGGTIIGYMKAENQSTPTKDATPKEPGGPIMKLQHSFRSWLKPNDVSDVGVSAPKRQFRLGSRPRRLLRSRR